MSAIPVIAIFDVGKTNKKLFLFDQQYQLVFEKTARFTETVDEDGESCENIENLRLSIFDSLREVFSLRTFDIKAINFSTYGASFVYLDAAGKPLTPLYNYLKQYPAGLRKQFYDTYGGESKVAHETASPVLGSLNSGLQLYRLKHQQPAVFRKVRHVLHLPQYMSFLITGHYCTDITSIGCHTQLWDFNKNTYHRWVKKERIETKLPPLCATDSVFPAAFPGNGYHVGIGLHDSSAALIPYLVNFREPFLLLSTGTWCISFNPFNQKPLTTEQLEQDCLCYLSYQGTPVKASRYFAGYEHEQQVKRIAAHFNQNPIRYRNIRYDARILARLQKGKPAARPGRKKEQSLTDSGFAQRDLRTFEHDIEAYHQLMLDIVAQQVRSTNLVLQDTPVRRIFVDGGFSKNTIYMNLMAAAYPGVEVFAASMAQASALGAAIAIHGTWNDNAIPNDIIALKYYSAGHELLL